MRYSTSTADSYGIISEMKYHYVLIYCLKFFKYFLKIQV